MAREARVVALEARCSHRLLWQRVEHGALLRILRSHLQHVAVSHPGHRHVVLVVDRARVAAVDLARLQAGLGERQDL
jgi:hypothetical protein